MKTINKILKKFTPSEDKLKHNWFGNTAFVLLLWFNIFISEWLPMLPFWAISLIIIGLSLVWEIVQKLNGGTNSKVEMANDIYYGNRTHFAISIGVVALQYYGIL